MIFNQKRSPFKIINLWMALLTLSGCSMLGSYLGRHLGKELSEDVFLFNFYVVSEFTFNNQLNNENSDNYINTYNKIIKLKVNYMLILNALNNFKITKRINEIKFKESDALYDTYDNLYDSRDNVQDFTKDDPWGHPYHYAVFNQNEFIMGTSGPNGKWDVKLDDQLNEKLFYGNFNCFKDDLFMKIKFAKGQDTLGGQDSK